MPALYRNVCAHGKRLFSHRCHVEIPDTALHAKLGIEKIGPDYTCGKVDVFSAVIALRYLLRDEIAPTPLILIALGSTGPDP